ncbi:LacI family DNA-binding transcriptional regulator [Actinoplanes derwentensis]|nr:LacI family DNA-binding transcriptional regulator [Actinoplanes derwentensis]GID87166.1 hypothetical protein Ade03nite_60900 [Actinoplanes derwentensis]
MEDSTASTRQPRGEIETLPSGSLRVRVYAGVDPITGKRIHLTETIPAGPDAQAEAEQIRDRLLAERDAKRRQRAAPTGQSPRHLRRTASGSDTETPQPATGAAPRAPGTRRGRRRGEMTVARIARLAGVSAPTVSKVLNGRSGVASETRRRVESVLREHEYRRPEMVVAAASVEVVFYGMQSNLAIEILHGVQRVVGLHKLAVGFTDVGSQAALGRSWAADLLARRPTGVITAHFDVAPEEHSLLAASGIPLVALDPTGQPSHDVPSVGATNWSGGIVATQHLLDLGHRDIAVISGPLDRLSGRARLEGARAALDSAGVGLDDRLVRLGLFSFADGLEHGEDLLTRPDRPTAVLCGNDLQALGVYEAARRHGLRIPEDLSVIGFDDIPNAQWCGPPLTTVRQPLADMGAAAGAMVLALAAGQRPEQPRVELATTLVVRESTAAPGRR